MTYDKHLCNTMTYDDKHLCNTMTYDDKHLFNTMTYDNCSALQHGDQWTVLLTMLLIIQVQIHSTHILSSENSKRVVQTVRSSTSAFKFQHLVFP